MSRIVLALSAIVLFLAGGLIANLVSKPSNGLAESDVRLIVETVLAENALNGSVNVQDPQGNTPLMAEQIHPIIDTYLSQNPRILERMSVALQAEIKQEKSDNARLALASMSDDIYNNPGNIVLGNPDGDVTLVEFYDYNCGFCRKSMPDLAILLEEDKNLRVIMQEFPILSQESMDAARIALAVHRAGADYWKFHAALFSVRGQASAQSALEVAKAMGLNPIELELDAKSDEIAQLIQKTYTIAENLSITGTPAYIIGDEIISGAVGVENLRARIANMRECGKTVC